MSSALPSPEPAEFAEDSFFEDLKEKLVHVKYVFLSYDFVEITCAIRRT